MIFIHSAWIQKLIQPTIPEPIVTDNLYRDLTHLCLRMNIDIPHTGPNVLYWFKDLFN